MRLYCLSGDPNYPCFVLTIKGCTIMLDCALNMKTIQFFLPQMLVMNQRFENMPNLRTQNGAVFENLKEFNNRIYLNSNLEFCLPQFNLINIEDLDAVLISSYNTMLALPYLTRHKNFRAKIYCTEPIMHFGRMLMEELTHYLKVNQAILPENLALTETDLPSEETSSKFPLFSKLKNLSIKIKTEEDILKETSGADDELIDESSLQPPAKLARNSINTSDEDNQSTADLINQLNSAKLYYSQLAQIFNINEASSNFSFSSSHIKPINWKLIYTKEDVDLCISKIELIGFNQTVNIFGSITVQPKSAGHSIGSCNWTIESDCDTFCYLSKSSLLNAHSKPFNSLFLKQQNIDCLLLTGLNQSPMQEPEIAIQDFCKACLVTIKNQGNVLVPVLPTGKIYDLIECLYRYLADANMNNVKVFFMSTVADQSLAYSNIFCEWLCDSKQNLVYAAESPFQHGELVKNGLLKVYPGINSKFNDDFNQPCILFASHPSLRFGEACHFVELWKNNPSNSFIFIDPEFNYLDALGPFQPIYANIYYFPIDTSLNTNQVLKLLKETKYTVQVIMSNAYKANTNEINMTNLDTTKIDHSRINPNTNINYYSQNDIIKLVVKRKYENCDIESELASMIAPSKKNFALSKDINDPSANNASFATFNAQILTKNNTHVLKAVPKTIPLTRRDRLNETNLKKYTYGKLNLDKFLNSLRQSGLNSFKITERDANSEITMDEILGEDNQSSSQNVSTNTNRYWIEMDRLNKIDVDLNTNKVNVLCENDDYRVKIKDCLLKCLKTL